MQEGKYNNISQHSHSSKSENTEQGLQQTD